MGRMCLWAEERGREGREGEEGSGVVVVARKGGGREEEGRRGWLVGRLVGRSVHWLVGGVGGVGVGVGW